VIKQSINKNILRLKIAAASALIPLILFTMNQFILQIFNIAHPDLNLRIKYAVQPTVYLLYLAAAVVIVIVINQQLSSLFHHITTGGSNDKARKSSLKIPWILILVNSGLWIATISLFYALQGFSSEGGVPYFWSLTTNSISGGISAILAALIINRILIPPKIFLNMTDINPGEKDLFAKIKIPLVFISSFIYLSLILIYAARFYAVAGTENLPLLPVSFNSAIFLTALAGFVPMILNMLLAVSEDRIQQRLLLKKMQILTSGNGDLSGKVNLINFDETGELAAVINTFIEKIRKLVIKTDRTGNQLAETSTDIENILSVLSSDTTTMLEGINSVDGRMSEQEDEIFRAKTALDEYFTALTELTDNIESQSASVTQTSRAAEDIASAIKNDSVIVREIDKQTGKLSSITENGSSHIADFISSIKNIEISTSNVEEILSHIAVLSQQIDILAMNAAIEAAHAGDAGRGFAVVADEVRKLSESTAEDSGQISVQVNLMRDSVEQGNKKTILADKAFQDIRQNVDSTTKHFQEVIDSTRKEELSVNELLATVGNLVYITESLKMIAQTQKEHNEKLKLLIENVFSRFGTLKDSMNSQRENRETVSGNLDKMHQITRENLKIVLELKDILKQFTF